jgi:DNA-binding NtrC family response regulator
VNTFAATDKPELLIVDDDPLITDTLDFVLGKDYSVRVAASRSQVKSLLRQMDSPPQLALIDLGLPPSPHRPDEGFHLIGELLAASPSMKIIVLSGQTEESNARYARTLGAMEFVAKPCEPEVLKSLLGKAREITVAEQSAAEVKSALIGNGAAITLLHQQITQYATSIFPVLVEGASGSGKELVANSLHQQSPRSNKPFLALNCAAISPTLVEPTLFGYSKGAFTGATTARSGYFEDARDGTLFLDEIGELPLELQAKLLRVLENGEFQRVGETLTRLSNARVFAATNRDLRSEVKAGRFRADLYHRLSVFTVQVPALQDMGLDKLLLLDHFSEFYSRQSGSKTFSLDPGATKLWLDYNFPGNVRELRNIVIRLCTKYPDRAVTADQLVNELDWDDPTSIEPAAPQNGTATSGSTVSIDAARKHLSGQQNIQLDQLLKDLERSYVEAALEITHGNLSKAARLLGMHRTTLYSRMQGYEQVPQEET